MDPQRKALELIELANSCPYYSLLGITVEEIKDGYAKLSMDINKKHLQMAGVAHGGAIISLADSTAGIAALYFYYPEKRVSTIEIKTNIIEKSLEGDKLTAIGKVIHKGRNTVICEAEVFNNNGRLVAKALATFFVTG